MEISDDDSNPASKMLEIVLKYSGKSVQICILPIYPQLKFLKAAILGTVQAVYAIIWCENCFVWT